MDRLTLVFVLAWSGAPSLVAHGQVARVELDHVFIVVQPGASPDIAASLRSAGFAVRPEPSRHEGQGTASVSVMFGNAYLELIWVDSSVRVEREHENTVRWFRDAASWRTTGVSPFGLGLRRPPGDSAALPVPVTRQSAAWLDPDAAYELLHQAGDSLAFDFFVVPPRMALPTWIGRVRERTPERLRHGAGSREVTLVRLYGPAVHVPAAFRVLQPKPVEVVAAPDPLLELYLDHGARGQRVDLRPALPLVLVR